MGLIVKPIGLSLRARDLGFHALVKEYVRPAGLLGPVEGEWDCWA